MAKIIIHTKDKDLPPMVIPDADYKGADSSIIKIVANEKEYWFNWSEIWFVERIGDSSESMGRK
jgi:hypothetical protein